MHKVEKGNAAYIKNMNKRLVLQCVIDHQPTSRAEISKKINISKPTVSGLVDQLLEDGWIYETGSGEASANGGRKPVHLCFNPRFAYVIGVDIGGTKVASGISDLNGNICAYREFPTQKNLESGLLEHIQLDIESMKEELNLSDDQILGMGVGVPGMTNVEEGIVYESPALGWKQYPIREKLSQYFDFPIFVDNDVNINVLGEHWKGAGQQKANLIYIAIGTGIGSGIMLNGQLYRGSNYSAGEIGYLVTDRIFARNYHPVYEGFGFLESVSSGSSIGDQLTKKIGSRATAQEAFQMYQQGHKDAVEIIDSAVENLALGIANYVSLFDPEIIILGGGVSRSYSMISEKINEIIERFAPKRCEVVATTFGKEAGVIGAVALFLKEFDTIFAI
ncbi:ROK family transcriptional regulator [Virgibacillus senegalensis]|uniref:ROK family transcriptional regulator n=1 Tax=Virgibacillus senegalensis TaxID=1499679 RepID=UPI000ABF8091|nr:ROK family transcriptional regulator [Virgibacillus senegalensis]